MDITGFSVRNIRNLVSEDGKTGAQSRRSHFNVNAVGANSTESAAAIPNNVHPAEWETTASASIGGGSRKAPKPMEATFITLSEKTDKVKPVKVHSAPSLIRALDDNGRKSVSIRQFSRKSRDTVDVVVNLDQVKELSYPLRYVQDEHIQKLRVSIQRNKFDYCRGVLAVTLQPIVDGPYTTMEETSVDGSVNEHLKPTVSVAFKMDSTGLQRCRS